VIFMDANVLSVKGMKKGKVKLPDVFSTPYRPDVIERAFLAQMSRKFQPKGLFPLAGLQSTANYRGRRESYRSGINKGLARLPRQKLAKGSLGQVRIVPFAKGGRREHGPNVNKIFEERINGKERQLAIKSAIAATCNKDLIVKRGQILGTEVPLIVEDALEALKKTSEVLELFKSLGLEADVSRAKEKKTIRAGRGKMRGRKYKRVKSTLIIVGEDKGIVKAAKNLEGVDVTTVKSLNVMHLAPGGVPGRLTVWTEDSLKKLGEIYG
jgi:large subunit ribosomal protein L4e